MTHCKECNSILTKKEDMNGEGYCFKCLSEKSDYYCSDCGTSDVDEKLNCKNCGTWLGGD